MSDQDYRLKAVDRLGEMTGGPRQEVYSYKVVRGMIELGHISCSESIQIFRTTADRTRLPWERTRTVWRWTRSDHTARSIITAAKEKRR